MEDMKPAVPAGKVLDEMNQVLSQRDKIYGEREAQIHAQMDKLREFEQTLVKQAEQLKKNKEEFAAYVSSEKKKLAQEKENLEQRRKEIEEYEKTTEATMSAVMQEHVRMQMQGNSSLEELRTREQQEIASSEGSLKLEALMEALGEALEEEGTEVTDGISFPAEEDADNTMGDGDALLHAEMQEGEVPESGENTATTQDEQRMDVFQPFLNVIEKKYPKWSFLDKSAEVCCFQIDAKKELRIFHKKDIFMEVQIVVFYKDAKKNSRLNASCAGIKRTAPEWNFSLEDTYVAWSIPFTTSTDPEVVFKTCNDFIKKHLK